MFCSKCGTQNPEGAKFCSKCGAVLGVSVTPSGTAPSQTTWKPTTAGILNIIAGAMAIIGGALVAPMWRMMTWPHMGMSVQPLVGSAIPMIILGVVAIVGGVYALKRRIWGLALAGSICALFGPWFILGVLAIIFVTIGKNEFE
jgi:hypothetical protein